MTDGFDDAEREIMEREIREGRYVSPGVRSEGAGAEAVCSTGLSTAFTDQRDHRDPGELGGKLLAERLKYGDGYTGGVRVDKMDRSVKPLSEVYDDAARRGLL